jgi:hypothetical protein
MGALGWWRRVLSVLEKATKYALAAESPAARAAPNP